MAWIGNINFLDNITPLNHDNMQKLVQNLDFLHDTIQGLIPMDESSGVTPLPATSGDGIIRYVVTISYDMLWVKDPSSSQPPSDKGDGRFFVAVLDDNNTHRYHLEIWCREQGQWKTDPNWAKEITTESGYRIQYSDHAWDRCTHDKLYVCQNTNKCYYMIDKYGLGWPTSISPGTTNQSTSFMIETAQACSVIWNGQWAGWTGLSHEYFLRYKMIIANLHLSGTETQYKGTEVEFSIAFNPWWLGGGNAVFVPFTIPYFSGNNDDPESVQTGIIKIIDEGSGGNVKFFAYVGSSYKQCWIDKLVGAADVKILWD